MQVLPQPRGPRSHTLIELLAEGPGRSGLPSFPDVQNPLADEDLQLALYLCYELHYRGIEGVDPFMEWDPRILGFRGRLEEAFERALRRAAPVRPATGSVTETLQAMAAAESRPSLSRYMARQANTREFGEFVIHRSLYTLKEADPHSFVIPRLDGAAKTALLEIQTDEYGGGRPERMHSAIFARTMRAMDLDDRYGVYLSVLPATTLATVNLVSYLSLHRRLRAAAMGHLALFELTSSVANRRYGNGLRRLGFGSDATDYFDEHVEADAVHDMIATHDVVGRMLQERPDLSEDVLFGARALAFVEDRFSTALLGVWRERRSSDKPRRTGALSPS